MTYNPKLPTDSDLAALQAAINQKANASTVGGIVTALNSKASQSAVDALATQKADAAALQAKADATAVAQALAAKADATALANKADASALAAKANASDVATALSAKADTSALAAKADAAVVAALSSTVSGKASSAELALVAAAMPVIANEIPQPEVTGGQAGIEGMKVPGAKHQHPRLSSTTTGSIAANGLATVTFTRTFTAAPGMVITEIPGTAPPQTMPATFKVESWVRDVMTPTPSGAYTGAVIRAWRSQVLPTQTTLSLVSLLSGVITGVNTLIASLTGFNIFGASVTGTAFSCIAIQRSDT